MVTPSASAFQPTLPARGATTGFCCSPTSKASISTHAPRTGSDKLLHNASSFTQDFNPRSPHGERPVRTSNQRNAEAFQPTLPARGATGIRPKILFSKDDFNPRSPHGERHRSPKPATGSFPISTHAPRTGSDQRGDTGSHQAAEFQPTLPARGATIKQSKSKRKQTISTHAPRTGSDLLSAGLPGLI